MSFEWDEDKNRVNLLKHGISFEEAELIFQGPIFSRPDVRFDYGEVRILSIGLIREIVAVALVHTDRDGTVRLISARLANRQERKAYHEHFGEASG